MKTFKIILCIIGIVLSVGLIISMFYSVINQNEVEPFFLKEGFILFGYLGVIIFSCSILFLAKFKKENHCD